MNLWRLAALCTGVISKPTERGSDQGVGDWASGSRNPGRPSPRWRTPRICRPSRRSRAVIRSGRCASPAGARPWLGVARPAAACRARNLAISLARFSMIHSSVRVLGRAVASRPRTPPFIPRKAEGSVPIAPPNRPPRPVLIGSGARPGRVRSPASHLWATSVPAVPAAPRRP